MKWLAVALLLLAAAPAQADPVTLIITAAQIAAKYAVISTTTAAFISLSAVVYGGIKTRRDAKRAAAAARRAYNDSLTDRTVTTLRADPPWRIVYGRCITGGDILAILTSDKAGTRDNGAAYTKPDAYKHLVVAVAAHEVEAIHEVYIDGVPVGALSAGGWATGGEFGSDVRTLYREWYIAAGGTLDAGSPPTVKDSFGGGGESSYSASVTVAGNVISNPNAFAVTVIYTVDDQPSWVRIEKALGTAGQTASAYLQAQCPAEWTADDRLRGIAHVIVTLDLENQRFQGGPPALTFDVSGRKVGDPRSSTTYWSSNPALIIRDWLTEPWGFGVKAADIDDATVIAAANACDASITLTVGAVSASGATYAADGAVTTDAPPEAVLEDMANAMAGFCTHTGGLWVVNAGAYTAPVLALTEATQAGHIEVVQAGVGYDELFNGVRARMIEQGRSVESEIDPYSNAAYVTADGAELWADISLPWTGNRARGRNLARILTEQTRESLVIRYPALLHAWPLQVGDRVTVTNAEYGWSAKVFRVTDWQWSVDSAVLLTLQEDAASIYDLADAATVDQAPNTGLPNPWLVPPISGVAAASGVEHALVRADGTRIPRVRVTWTAISSAYITQGGQVLVRWRRTSGDEIGAWRTVQAPGDATYTYIDGVQGQERLAIAVIAVNSLGARGPETVIAHTVSTSLTVGTGAIEPEAVTSVSHIDVVTDTFATPALSGVDIATKDFGPLVYVNDTGGPQLLELVYTASRQVVTPADLTATVAEVVSGVYVFDDAGLTSVVTSLGSGFLRARDMVASESYRWNESHAQPITVPAGETYRFVPRTVIQIAFGSSGPITLTTKDLYLYFVVIKR